MKHGFSSLIAIIVFFTGCFPGAESVKIQSKIDEIDEIEYIQIRLEDPSCAAGCSVDRVSDSGETVCFREESVLTAADILKASSVNGNALGYVIALELNSSGRVKLDMITRGNRGKRLGVYVAGKMVTAPVINSVISDGKALIAGGFTRIEAEEIAAKLNARLK